MLPSLGPANPLTDTYALAAYAAYVASSPVLRVAFSPKKLERGMCTQANAASPLSKMWSAVLWTVAIPYALTVATVALVSCFFAATRNSVASAVRRATVRLVQVFASTEGGAAIPIAFASLASLAALDKEMVAGQHIAFAAAVQALAWARKAALA